MKKLISIMILIAIAGIAWAQTTDEESFRAWAAADQAAYEEFVKLDDMEFEKFKEEIEKEWDEFVTSTKKDWVSYSSEFKGRSKVDFEEGKVEVEAVISADDAKDKTKAKEVIKAHLKAIINSKDNGNETILTQQVEIPKAIQEQIKSATITPRNVDAVATALAENIEPVVVKTPSGKKRLEYKLDLVLVPGHIKLRAEKYRSLIEKECERFGVDPALALAIMHTESYFNPKAYNRHGNAYGLMQVVPTSAGHVMNKIIYNKAKDPSKKFLFTPAGNIEFGVGYLRYLMGYFADKQVKLGANGERIPVGIKGNNLLWCIIPSYNGGYGQVFYGMTGKMSKIGKRWEPMWRDLRDLDSEKLYNKLINDMAAKETRDYLKKVRAKMEKLYGFKA